VKSGLFNVIFFRWRSVVDWRSRKRSINQWINHSFRSLSLRTFWSCADWLTLTGNNYCCDVFHDCSSLL